MNIKISTNITSLESFFDSSIDSNTEKIISINLFNFNSSLITTFDRMFYGCNSIQNINLSNFISSSVNTATKMFYGCSQLKSIDLSSFETTKLENMQYMFYGCSQLQSINLSNFYTPLLLKCDYMFYGCNNLSSIIITNFDTSKVENMSYMFYGCSQLLSINLLSFNTEVVKNMDYMFYGCSKLQSIDLSNFNTPLLQNTESMFKGCGQLQSIALSNFDTSKVVNMQNMFYGCSELHSINLANFDTSKVENMKYMFYGCSQLQSINLSNFNTPLLQQCDSLFYGCNHLSSIIITNFDTSKVENISYIFYGCSQLKSIDISNFNTRSIKNMEYLFYGCSQLQSINLSNFNTLKVESMKYMFYDCRELISVDLSNFNTPLLQKTESMFEGCSKLQSLVLSNFNSSLIISMNNMFKGCTNLEYLDISNFDNTPSNIASMFEGVNNLEYINIYNVVSSSNLANIISSELNIIYNLFVCQKNKIITNPNNIYVCCDFNITSRKCDFSNYIILYYYQNSYYETGFINEFRKDVSFLDYNNITIATNTELTILENTQLLLCFNNPVTNMTKFFSKEFDNNMINVSLIDFYYFNSSLVTCLTDIFSGCNALELINFTFFDTSQVFNMENMFLNCTSLKSIDITGFITNNLKNMNSMFSGCSSLELLDFSNFNTSKVIYMSNMFQGCQSIKNLDLSKFDTKSVENMSSMFSGCSSLEILNIFSFNTQKVKNMEGMFSNCSSLTSIDISNFITYNLENMNSMFSGCSSLESIILLNMITSKVRDMSELFKGCLSLKSIELSQFDTRTVEKMNSMFSQCESLVSLNLSNFDTSVVNNMDYMFYNCTSLKILDISNFNMLKTISSNGILTGLINIRFINIYNVKDNNNFASSGLNTDTNRENIFYVCQDGYFITNPKSLDCCDYYDNEAHCNDNNTENINELINKEVMNAYNNALLNIKEKDYKIVQTNHMTLQFSTVEEQLKNKTEKVSSIDLGECENKLREQEGLNETEQFIMIKLDVMNLTSKAVHVQYEIFNPRNFSKVSLDICSNITIKMNVPVILEDTQLSLISHLQDSGYNVFDITDDFYNDVCSTYKAKNGADMTLSARKNKIYDNIKEISLCQKGCEFEKFETNTSKAVCNCNIQKNETVTDVKDISFDKSEFFDGFYSTLFNSNFRVLKCVKLIFSIKGIKSNYGFYIMTFLLGSFISFVISHLYIGNTKIINIVNNIIKSKEFNEVDNNNGTEGIQTEQDTERGKTSENLDLKIKDLQAPPRKRKKTYRYFSKYVFDRILQRKNTQKTLGEPNEKKEEVISEKKSENTNKNEIEKKSENTNKNEIEIKSENTNKNEIEIKIENTNKNEIEKKSENKIENKDKDNKSDNEIDQYKGLTDEEKNDLDYEEAIIEDKRTFWQYYISLLKRGQLIIFTFIITDDYNLRQIKILLFIISFSLFFAVNAFFFGDETMDKIYEDNAMFNFIFQIPQILYSSIISTIIDIIMKKLTISEEQILVMKKEKDKKKFLELANEIKNKLKIKLITFLVLSSTLMLFFWYFISCFCAAFGNTQHLLISDTFISFLTSMIYPFGLKLLPGILRIPSLRSPQKNKKFLYKISQLLDKLL